MAAASGGVEVVLPLTPPVVVELFGCTEFDWSVEDCGVVLVVPVVELD